MKSRGYWTYDRCKEVVKKYKTKKDLYTNDGSVYVTITRNKWFDLIDNLNMSENDIFKRLIYSYEFSDNSCYVGLTFNIEKRNKQHLSGNENSSVHKHIKKTGLIPKLIIKSEMINMSDAVNMENFILNEYISNGWNILNIARTGSVGGFSTFNIKTCIDRLNNCDTLKLFRLTYKSDYNYIIKHDLYNLNNDIRELMDKKRGVSLSIFKNKELCKIESMKYSKRTHFQNENKSAYNNAWRCGWLDEFYPKNI